MKKFEVVINTVVHTLYSKVIEVEAASSEEAIDKANDAIDTDENLMDLNDWNIEDSEIDVEVVDAVPLKEE